MHLLKITSVVAGLLASVVCSAEIRLPRMVRDSMVLQRDTKLNIWGWAAPGEKVTVKFAGKSTSTKTGTNGEWLLQLPPLKAGGPFEMKIDGSNHLVLKEVLIGDVWLCSGQSNMVHQMALHYIRYADDIAKANYPQIRHFWVPTIANMQGPAEDLPAGNWQWANPKDVLQFSAVAYFFARNLYEKYHVPIGLINASYGGSPIEAWISEDGLQAFPDVAATLTKNKDTAYVNGANKRSGTGGQAPRSMDKGLNEKMPWYSTDYQPKGWRTINIPGYWEDQGVRDLNGSVWFRKEIEVPASMAAQPAFISMGRIVDADFLYVNGKLVGSTSYMYPQRRYTLPSGLLKAGKNLFVIRVLNNSGKGGFVPDKPYFMAVGKDTVDLKGTWEYKVGEVYYPRTGFGGGGIAAQNQPAALFNSMVAPYIHYNIKGFVWYQGESNTGNAAAYNQLLSTLVSDWRSKWGMPAAPFIYAQLPGFMDVDYLPTESSWAMLREAQLNALSIPNTAMAVTIDLGEWNDIHPDRKKEVGDRLALAAEKIAYGETGILYSGPIFKSAEIKGNQITISFSNIGGGLITNDGEELRTFSIAGADKKFIWATAKIEGNTVVVSNDAIPTPMYVRYAWADNPAEANLYNTEGLPASPFRTDK